MKDFPDLVNQFTKQFTCSRGLKKQSSDLFRVVLQPWVMLRPYLNRFIVEMVAIPRYSLDMAIDAFKRGLATYADLYDDLTKYPCVAFEDVQSRTLAHIELEEDKAF